MRLGMRVVLGLVAASLLAAATHVSAQENSHARIVRLSFAEGTVSVQRPDVSTWATAPVNTPLQEGYTLSTGKDSFAEVEFENASTARIGENSLLEFNELALTPAGGKVNRLTLHQGYGTFHVTPGRDDVYEVKVADATLVPDGKSEFRADLDQEHLRVEVFKGSVAFSGPNGSEKLSKNKVLEFESGSDEAYSISHGITTDSWDDWVAERDELQAENRPPSVYSSQVGPTYYGWSDLYGYGSWTYFPRLGYGWFPDVGYGWSPFTLGRWVWYPGFGYTWISYEPWGWLPYHYGNWYFEPQFGWFWVPGAFGAWCPALVTWYQGPGWIGWTPQPAAGAKKQGCLQTKGCVTAVDLNTFQSGKPITPPSIIGVSAEKGQEVTNPDIPPTRLARLPGLPVPERPAWRDGVPAREASTGVSIWVSRSPGTWSRPAPHSDLADSFFGSVAGHDRGGSTRSSHAGGGFSSHSSPRSSSGAFGGGGVSGGGMSGGSHSGGGSHSAGSHH